MGDTTIRAQKQGAEVYDTIPSRIITKTILDALATLSVELGFCVDPSIDVRELHVSIDFGTKPICEVEIDHIEHIPETKDSDGDEGDEGEDG